MYPFLLFTRVEDKQRVANLTCVPIYLPEVTIGAHEFDAAYYAFKSVCGPTETVRVNVKDRLSHI